jgi:hypothetical protein
VPYFQAHHSNCATTFFVAIFKTKMLPDKLHKKYPPSPPCNCEECRNYCKRPGWWSVAEAERAFRDGYANRMMLEIAPEGNFGVLSPAFKGNEGQIALKQFSQNGCTFFSDGLCELYGTGYEPIECRFCHHSRKGLGIKCHLELELDWHTNRGANLIKTWCKETKL